MIRDTLQREEYHLQRGESEYLLEVSWRWVGGGLYLNSEGEEDAEPGTLEVVDVEVWGRWDGPGDDAGPGEFIEPLPLDPPMTEQEITDFDEWLADQAAAAAEQEDGWRR